MPRSRKVRARTGHGGNVHLDVAGQGRHPQLPAEHRILDVDRQAQAQIVAFGRETLMGRDPDRQEHVARLGAIPAQPAQADHLAVGNSFRN